MNKERELLRRAYELLDRRGQVENFDKRQQLLFDIHTYFSTTSDDAEEPTHMNFQGLTLEEMESCIKGNLTITDPNLREGVIASIIDAEHLLMEKNTNGDEPAALKEEE